VTLRAGEGGGLLVEVDRIGGPPSRYHETFEWSAEDITAGESVLLNAFVEKARAGIAKTQRITWGRLGDKLDVLMDPLYLRFLPADKQAFVRQLNAQRIKDPDGDITQNQVRYLTSLHRMYYLKGSG